MLKAFFERCRHEEMDCLQLLLPGSLIENLVKKIEEGSLRTVLDVVNYFEANLPIRDYCRSILEAFKSIGLEIRDCETAGKLFTREYADWVLSLLEQLGFIKLRESWRSGENAG